ncbi:MAG: flippase [Bacilli bacterium]
MKIAKNSFYNIAGYLIPGVLSIPILGFMARDLGVEKFGLFTIILAIVGYASIFDIGITRSVIREIAIYKRNKDEILKILSTSAVIVVALGIIAGFLITIFNTKISEFLNVSKFVTKDFLDSLAIVAFSIPLYLLTQVWCSLLEGREEFLKLNIYKTFSSTMVVAFPALALLIESSLSYAVMGLLVARFLSLLLIKLYCRDFSSNFKFYNDVFKRLISFGGWVAVSNFISPIMSYFDRFILANKMGASMVGFYTAPSEAISRISMLPSAVARTIFPMLSSGEDDSGKIKITSYILVLLFVIPVGCFCAYFSYDIMSLWLGNEYALKSYIIFQILILGFVFNSIAQIPFASIQSNGRSKTTAILHLCELFPYLILLYYLIDQYGLVGAAWAWTIRMFIDMFLLIIYDRN